MRAAAIIEEQFEAVAHLKPSGAHELEVRGALGTARFTEGMLPRLKEAIADFEREVMFEDGRPDSRRREHRVLLAGRG